MQTGAPITYVSQQPGHRDASITLRVYAHWLPDVPDDIIFAADLPKTRSGKIMRRLLREIAEGKALGDTTTLADPAVVARFKEQYESQE